VSSDAIWRTIQSYFESDSRAIRDNSSTIRDLSAIRVADLSAAGVTIGAMATKIFPSPIFLFFIFEPLQNIGVDNKKEIILLLFSKAHIKAAFGK